MAQSLPLSTKRKKHVHFAQPSLLAEEIKFYMDSIPLAIVSTQRHQISTFVDTGNVIHRSESGAIVPSVVRRRIPGPTIVPTLNLGFFRTPFVAPLSGTAHSFANHNPPIVPQVTITHPNPTSNIHVLKSLEPLSSRQHSHSGRRQIEVKQTRESGFTSSQLHRDFYAPLPKYLHSKRGHYSDITPSSHHVLYKQPSAHTEFTIPKKTSHRTKRDVYDANRTISKHVSSIAPVRLFGSHEGTKLLKRVSRLQNMELSNQLVAADLAARRHADINHNTNHQSKSPSSSSFVFAYGSRGATYTYSPHTGEKQYTKR